MAARLRTAGFADAEVHVFSAAPRKAIWSPGLRGTAARKPILLLAHLDVVRGQPWDWSSSRQKADRKDGILCARQRDDKYMAAAFGRQSHPVQARKVTKPDRDIIIALETDEEILDADAVGIQWLLKNHRDLIDAEFALNGAAAWTEGRQASGTGVQTARSLAELPARRQEQGGTARSRPRTMRLYHLAEGLCVLSKFSFPLRLNETTARLFRRTAQFEGEQTGRDMRTVLSDKLIRPRCRSVGSRPIRSITRSCHHLCGHDARGGTCGQRLAAMGERQGELPIMPGESSTSQGGRWSACSRTPDHRHPARSAGLRAPSALHEEIMDRTGNCRQEFWPALSASDHERGRYRRKLSA